MGTKHPEIEFRAGYDNCTVVKKTTKILLKNLQTALREKKLTQENYNTLIGAIEGVASNEMTDSESR